MEVQAPDKNTPQVRVRIPPSPTGDPHLGTAYMAVFNKLFALATEGKVVLRFEDTDPKRNVEGSEKAIIKGLNWLGIQWDEGPYRQSERLETYRQYAQELVEADLAYKNEGAIFLQVDDNGEVEFTDEIRGTITTPKSEIKDQVLIKSDGIATYNFAAVVDDAITDNITHVIRGEGHISNTPKQILMYEALGQPLPKFAHFPHIKGEGGEKLSKRHGAGSVLQMQERGFLPEALVNYLILLGWTHPDEKDILTIQEAAKLFKLKKMHQSAPTFDLEKLTWLNGQWISKMNTQDLRFKIQEFYTRKAEKWDQETFQKVVPLVQERMRTLAEFAELTDYFFTEGVTAPQDKLEKHIPNSQSRSAFLLRVLRDLHDLPEDQWDAATLEKILRSTQEEHNLSPKQAFMTLRVALTGQTATPGLFETIEALGKPKTLQRLHRLS